MCRNLQIKHKTYQLSVLDSFSVAKFVRAEATLGFSSATKTPLSNKCMRDLPGLKPRLRFLDRGATNARANRGHVIPRHSAFFRGQKKDQREILCAAADCMAAGVDCDRGRAKLPLSRAVRQDAERRGSAGALRSQAGGRLGGRRAIPMGWPVRNTAPAARLSPQNSQQKCAPRTLTYTAYSD